MVLPFRRVLVTGGTGFVGRYLLPRLATELGPDCDLVVGARRPDGSLPGRPLHLDLFDAAGLAEAVRTTAPDLIVHLAAQASVLKGAAETWQANAAASLSLARAVADYAAGCTVLLVSSSEVYGGSFRDGVVTETSPTWPLSAYARSKVAAEAIFADVLPAESRLVTVRPSNHTGPGQDQRFAVPSFAAQIARIEAGRATRIEVGNLEAHRDFLDVRDVVDGYVTLLTRRDDLPMRSVFNLSSEREIRMIEVLDGLRRLSRTECPVVVDPARTRPSDIPRAAIDSSAVRAAIGWQPRRTLDETLASVLDYWRGQIAATVA